MSLFGIGASFSSLLDIDKLIRLWLYYDLSRCFSSLLDIDKLIPACISCIAH